MYAQRPSHLRADYRLIADLAAQANHEGHQFRCRNRRRLRRTQVTTTELPFSVRLDPGGATIVRLIT
jgi:hypothetical protein